MSLNKKFAPQNSPKCARKFMKKCEAKRRMLIKFLHKMLVSLNYIGRYAVFTLFSNILLEITP